MNYSGKIYTIGHSTHGLDYFTGLLQQHKIDTIVDVRSAPYSKFVPQYNRETLQSYLKQNNIYYIYMGDFLGARHEEDYLLFDDDKNNGRVNFSKVRKTDFFQKGISRLKEGINKGHNIAMMCSEKEAFDCHRFGLISKALKEEGIEVRHIYPDKVLSQQELEEHLVQKYSAHQDFPKEDLLNPATEDLAANQLEVAYKLRNLDIGYRKLVVSTLKD